MKDELTSTIHQEFCRAFADLRHKMRSVLEEQTETFVRDNSRAIAQATKWLNDKMSKSQGLVIAAIEYQR